MKITETIAETRAACRALRSKYVDGTLGLVPTMGALHEGHLSLVRAARQRCEAVAVSLFVNPTQFAPHEDLARYPRTFEADRKLLEKAGVDLLFAPQPEEMYPGGSPGVVVDPGELGTRLDGASRPGHFRGVCTVVSKLFHITAPDQAFFGQKDAAQVAVLRQMVRDLDFGVEIVALPIVRDESGLALSSRNRYLSVEEKDTALCLSHALKAAQRMAKSGEKESQHLLTAMHRELAAASLTIDYVAVVDPDTLLPKDQLEGPALLAVAAYVGSTRLIDNVLLEAHFAAGTTSPASGQ